MHLWGIYGAPAFRFRPCQAPAQTTSAFNRKITRASTLHRKCINAKKNTLVKEYDPFLRPETEVKKLKFIWEACCVGKTINKQGGVMTWSYCHHPTLAFCTF